MPLNFKEQEKTTDLENRDYSHINSSEKIAEFAKNVAHIYWNDSEDLEKSVKTILLLVFEFCSREEFYKALYYYDKWPYGICTSKHPEYEEIFDKAERLEQEAREKETSEVKKSINENISKIL